MNQPEINIGIDTSQSQLDIGVLPSGKFFSVDNNERKGVMVLYRFS
ncbi:hypothetical protein [Arenicella xantha]|nr:hypothetical protein [Arenicella xantha]